jgi:hypothetical protein
VFGFQALGNECQRASGPAASTDSHLSNRFFGPRPLITGISMIQRGPIRGSSGPTCTDVLEGIGTLRPGHA